jgi:hypothetical protein
MMMPPGGIKLPHDDGGDTGHHRIRSDVPGDHCARGDHGALADRNAGKNRDPGTDPHPIPDRDGRCGQWAAALLGRADLVVYREEQNVVS